MTRGLAILRATKLLAQTRCPVCGSVRNEAIGCTGSPIATVVYACTAEFVVDCNGAITPMNICPSASYVAAEQLNAEARADATRKVGAA